jgi:hypothetical protein
MSFRGSLSYFNSPAFEVNSLTTVDSLVYLVYELTD